MESEISTMRRRTDLSVNTDYESLRVDIKSPAGRTPRRRVIFDWIESKVSMDLVVDIDIEKRMRSQEIHRIWSTTMMGKFVSFWLVLGLFVYFVEMFFSVSVWGVATVVITACIVLRILVQRGKTMNFNPLVSNSAENNVILSP